jgi:hypothetical protein
MRKSITYIGASATPGLMGVLAQDDPTLWQPALELLQKMGDHRALATLYHLQNHPDEGIKSMVNAAIGAIEARPAPPTPPAHRPQVTPPSAGSARPPLSGKFDADLEQKIVQALFQITSPDPDDKRTGWQILNTLVAQATPIIQYYAQGELPLSHAAQSVITTLNLK